MTLLSRSMAKPRKHPCKICGADAPLYGAIDFHKKSPSWRNYTPRPSGDMVFYNRCEICGFVFTSAFDHWGISEFSQFIYNDEFQMIDGQSQQRAVESARFVQHVLGPPSPDTTVLDYGGGTGLLAQLLLEMGFSRAVTYDPFVERFNTPPQGTFDVVTSFEVLEHTPDPHRTVQDIRSFCKDTSVVLFTTRIQPPDFEERGLYWWYVSPRVGHISIHSAASLKYLWEHYGFHVSSLSDGAHLAVPRIAAPA